MTEALLSENGGYIRYVDGTIRASNHLIHCQKSIRVKRGVRIDVQTKGRGIGTLLRRTKVSPASADLQIHRRTRRPIPPLRGYLIKSTINSR